MSRIAERNARLEESSEAPPAQRYRVVVSSAKDGYTGRLEQPETQAVREVSGTDCARVVDALALVVRKQRRPLVSVSATHVGSSGCQSMLFMALGGSGRSWRCARTTSAS
jgi:hypothetical protein